MAKQKIARIADILGFVNRICPPDLAEEWDNVGLQVGDLQSQVSKILVCLDAEEVAVREAQKQGAQLIISHHPLIFRPLKRLAPTDQTGRVIFSAIKNDMAIISAHTNLDRARDGLNDWLAARLRLSAVEPLEAPAAGRFVKLVVYVPEGHEETLMDAVFAAGAGQIGDYDRCSFRVKGTGTFRGGADSDPFIGTPGEQENAEELRLETIVPKASLGKVVNRMIKAHPYEEVAYDILPLNNAVADGVGLGRIGRLEETTTLEAFAGQVRNQLGGNAMRMVGEPDQKITKVAVCGGSGMSVFSDAVRLGADCLVTGDVKFHDAQRARAEGVALIDAGHFATERLMIKELSSRLRVLGEENQFVMDIIEMAAEKDPFIPVI